MKPQPLKVLVLDDEDGMRRLLKGIVRDMGCQPFLFDSPQKALAALERDEFDLGIVDIKMPLMNGVEFLRQALTIAKELPVVMITAYGNIEGAVECMKAGAFDYITKPFQADEIHFTVNRLLERRALIRENLQLRQKLDVLSEKNEIVGKSRKMAELLELARKIADTHFKVLITGESGTGKELMARYIHNHSGRREKPFVPVQCSLLPENLLESELFGHRRGSFTGAVQDKTGLFEEAGGGTLFLDEIGDINLGIQGKLLRFLQEHEVKKIGDTKTKTLDVRMISATNKNLEALVKAKSFREDLYYRLKVTVIHMPALRDRKEDIVLLANHFLRGIGQELGREIGMEKECYPILSAHPWPGNIREMKNCLENASSICSKGVIRAADVQTALMNATPGPHVHELDELPYREAKEAVLKEFEREYALKLLAKNKGNISKSAQAAGMDKKNFWVILQRCGINYKDLKTSE